MIDFFRVIKKQLIKEARLLLGVDKTLVSSFGEEINGESGRQAVPLLVGIVGGALGIGAAALFVEGALTFTAGMIGFSIGFMVFSTIYQLFFGPKMDIPDMTTEQGSKVQDSGAGFDDNYRTSQTGVPICFGRSKTTPNTVYYRIGGDFKELLCASMAIGESDTVDGIDVDARGSYEIRIDDTRIENALVTTQKSSTGTDTTDENWWTLQNTYSTTWDDRSTVIDIPATFGKTTHKFKTKISMAPTAWNVAVITGRDPSDVDTINQSAVFPDFWDSRSSNSHSNIDIKPGLLDKFSTPYFTMVADSVNTGKIELEIDLNSLENSRYIMWRDFHRQETWFNEEVTPATKTKDLKSGFLSGDKNSNKFPARSQQFVRVEMVTDDDSPEIIYEGSLYCHEWYKQGGDIEGASRDKAAISTYKINDTLDNRAELTGLAALNFSGIAESDFLFSTGDISYVAGGDSGTDVSGYESLNCKYREYSGAIVYHVKGGEQNLPDFFDDITDQIRKGMDGSVYDECWIMVAKVDRKESQTGWRTRGFNCQGFYMGTPTGSNEGVPLEYRIDDEDIITSGSNEGQARSWWYVTWCGPMFSSFFSPWFRIKRDLSGSLSFSDSSRVAFRVSCPPPYFPLPIALMPKPISTTTTPALVDFWDNYPGYDTDDDLCPFDLHFISNLRDDIKYARWLPTDYRIYNYSQSHSPVPFGQVDGDEIEWHPDMCSYHMMYNWDNYANDILYNERKMAYRIKFGPFSPADEVTKEEGNWGGEDIFPYPRILFCKSESRWRKYESHNGYMTGLAGGMGVFAGDSLYNDTAFWWREDENDDLVGKEYLDDWEYPPVDIDPDDDGSNNYQTGDISGLSASITGCYAYYKKLESPFDTTYDTSPNIIGACKASNSNINVSVITDMPAIYDKFFATDTAYLAMFMEKTEIISPNPVFSVVANSSIFKYVRDNYLSAGNDSSGNAYVDAFVFSGSDEYAFSTYLTSESVASQALYDVIRAEPVIQLFGLLVNGNSVEESVTGRASGDWGIRVHPDNIDMASFRQVSRYIEDICTGTSWRTFTFPTGTTYTTAEEPSYRYEYNWVASSTSEALSLINDLLTSFKGRLFWAGNKLKLVIEDFVQLPSTHATNASKLRLFNHPHGYGTPKTLDEDNIVMGSVSVQKSPLSTKPNIIRLKYRDESLNWAAEDVSFWKGELSTEQYFDENNTKEITALGITSQRQAFRLAEHFYHASRLDEIFSCAVALRDVDLEPGEFVKFQPRVLRGRVPQASQDAGSAPLSGWTYAQVISTDISKDFTMSVVLRKINFHEEVWYRPQDLDDNIFAGVISRWDDSRDEEFAHVEGLVMYVDNLHTPGVSSTPEETHFTIQIGCDFEIKNSRRAIEFSRGRVPKFLTIWRKTLTYVDPVEIDTIRVSEFAGEKLTNQNETKVVLVSEKFENNSNHWNRYYTYYVGPSEYSWEAARSVGQLIKVDKIAYGKGIYGIGEYG